MQCVYFLVIVAALAAAAPPSHSYLPPSPTSRNNAYPQEAPGALGFQATQVVATRNFEQGNSANSFSRTSPSQYNAAGSEQPQGYDGSATAFVRNSIETNSTVRYEADGRGFKPQISYEDSEDLALSTGYNSNANSRNLKNVRQDAHS